MVKPNKTSVSEAFKVVYATVIRNGLFYIEESQYRFFNALFSEAATSEETIAVIQEYSTFISLLEQEQAAIVANDEMRASRQQELQEQRLEREMWIERCKHLKQLETRLGKISLSQLILTFCLDPKAIYAAVGENIRQSDSLSQKLAIALLTISKPERALQLDVYGESSLDFAIFSPDFPNGQITLTNFGLLLAYLGLISASPNSEDVSKLIVEAIDYILMIHNPLEVEGVEEEDAATAAMEATARTDISIQDVEEKNDFLNLKELSEFHDKEEK